MKSIKYVGLWLLTLYLGFGCKKPKPIVFSGQLLLTKKNPVPLSNKRIEIFQLGGGSAILFNSSGSSATAMTDANGYFSITFTPGTSSFTVFSSENTSPLSFGGAINDTISFMRQYFPEPNYDASKPIFVGKSIDTIVVNVSTFKEIIASDTLGLRGSSFNKEYTGITADSASTFTLDTIYNALFTNFNCSNNTFLNDIYFGRVITGYNKYISGGGMYNELFNEDETKAEMSFPFNY